jgi:hypothetical protein
MAETESDLDKARQIVASHGSFVGQGRVHREDIAKAVAEGIALGRDEGFELALKALAEMAKASKAS